MRVFLDTNILLDVLMNRPGLVAESEAAILHCEILGTEMFVAWHGLATAYYLLRRGRTEPEAMLEVDGILAWARVANAGDGEARRARSLGFADFEDAMQAASAEACGAEWIITRDLTGFANSPVPVLSPTDFLVRFPLPAS
jgi:predicted nucleic acid-binding protein